jgi:hypothetical protein
MKQGQASAGKAAQSADAARNAKLREFFARAPEIPAAQKPPLGFNLDPGKDEQREIQIRVAGNAQAASASMSADAYQIIFWIPPQPKRGSQP